MFNLLKKHKIILLILIFIVLLLINTKVNSATTYTFTSEQYYDNMPEAVSNSIKSLSYWNDNSYACFGFHNGAYPYRVVFVKSTSSTVTLDAGHIYFPSVKPYYIFTYNANGTLRSSETYNGNYGYEGISSKSFIFKNVKVVDNSTNINSNNIVKPIPEVSDFYIEYNENTKSYFVYTDYMDYTTFSMGYSAFFNIDGFQTSFYYDTYENYGWRLMDFEPSIEENEDGSSNWRYFQEILEYGEYYFCLRNHETKEHKIYCINITADSSSISKYNPDYTDSSDMFKQLEYNEYEYNDYLSTNNENIYVIYENNIAIVYTNYFKEDDTYYYDCLYSKDYLNYNDDIITEYYDGANINYSKYYRFCKEIEENNTYYFKLRKIDKTTGDIISSKIYTIVVDGIIVNNVGENDTVDFYRNTNTMEYFRKTLGIVFFPVDMMFNFFERLENVQSQEPIIVIPDIKEPFTRTSFY